MELDATITDEQLLTGYAASGDGDLFAELERRYSKSIFGAIYPRIKNHARTEEAVQDVFLRIHQNCKQYDGRSRASSWIFGIAFNRATDLWRKRSKHPEFSLPDGTMELNSDPHSFSGQAAVDVADLLERLPATYRRVIELSNLKGLLYREVADHEGIPIGTMKSRHHDAMRKLRELAT